MNAPMWTCDHCSQPTRTGWLICDAYRANQGNGPVAWGVYCPDHAPDEQSGDYSLSLNQLGTTAKIDHWHEHVARKRWFANTIWPARQVATT